MARGQNASAGCFGTLFIVLVPFFWIQDKCSGGEERRAREQVEREQREANERAAYARQRQQAEIAEAQRKAAEEKAAADLLAAQKAHLVTWKPYQRVQAVQQCLKSDCPDGAPNAKLVIESG